jgi:hypothetical protein
MPNNGAQPILNANGGISNGNRNGNGDMYSYHPEDKVGKKVD